MERSLNPVLKAVTAAAILGVCVTVLSTNGFLRAFFLLPYDQLATCDQSGHWTFILSHPVAIALNIGQWTIAALAFGYLCRHRRWRWLPPLALVAVVLVGLLSQLIVRAFGMNFYWDFWR